MERILIIDNHPLLRAGAEQVLAEELQGASIKQANAADAIDLVQQYRWQVIVLGLPSAGLAGLNLLNRVKAAANGAPIVVLSVETDHQHAVIALRQGAAAALSKTAPVDEFVRAVRVAAHGRRYVSSAVAELLVSELDGTAEAAPHRSLSPAEYTVFCALVAGRSLTDIAHSLNRSPKTVSTFRSRILRKLRVNTTVELVHYAMRHNLLGHETP